MQWTASLETKPTGTEWIIQEDSLLANYRARIISWWFRVGLYWNAMLLAQNVDYQSWIQEVHIIAMIGDMS